MPMRKRLFWRKGQQSKDNQDQAIVSAPGDESESDENIRMFDPANNQ